MIWVFIGCSDDDNDIMTLKIVSSDVEFQAPGGSGTIIFVSSATVSVTSNQEWLKLGTPGSGSVSYEVATNDGISARVATVTFTAGGISESVAINQMGTIFDLEENYEISALSQETQFELYTNSDNVSVTSEANWVKVSIENGYLKIIPELNTVGDRSTFLTFSSGWKTKKVTLTQASLISSSKISLDGTESVYTFSINPDIEKIDNSWTIESEGDWYTTSKNGLDITVNAPQNDTGTPRKGKIKIKAGEVVIEIDVTQSSIVDYYKYFLGTWNIKYDNKSKKVTFVEKEANKSYIMTGLELNVLINYDVKTHRMSMTTQEAGILSPFYIHLCVIDNAAGYFTWTQGTGFNLIFNNDESNNELAAVDNGLWGNYKANSFSFEVFTSKTPSNSSYFTTLTEYVNFTGFSR